MNQGLIHGEVWVVALGKYGPERDPIIRVRPDEESGRRSCFRYA